jgi:adenine deaminase
LGHRQFPAENLLDVSDPEFIYLVEVTGYPVVLREGNTVRHHLPRIAYQHLVVAGLCPEQTTLR